MTSNDKRSGECFPRNGCKKRDWAKNDMKFSGNRSIDQVADYVGLWAVLCDLMATGGTLKCLVVSSFCCHLLSSITFYTANYTIALIISQK